MRNLAELVTSSNKPQSPCEQLINELALLSLKYADAVLVLCTFEVRSSRGMDTFRISLVFSFQQPRQEDFHSKEFQTVQLRLMVRCCLNAHASFFLHIFHFCTPGLFLCQLPNGCEGTCMVYPSLCPPRY